MSKAGQEQASGMSPLARLLQAKAEEMPYREMERHVLQAKGIRFTSSSFEQVAKDQRADRLTAGAIRAVAEVLGLRPGQVAVLDDERHGIRHAKPGEAEDVATAILGDVDLIDEARDHLLAQYELLRRIAPLSDVADSQKPPLRAVAHKGKSSDRAEVARLARNARKQYEQQKEQSGDDG